MSPINLPDCTSGQFQDATEFLPLAERDEWGDSSEMHFGKGELISNSLDPEQVAVLRGTLDDVTLPLYDRERIIETLSLNCVECHVFESKTETSEQPEEADDSDDEHKGVHVKFRRPSGKRLSKLS